MFDPLKPWMLSTPRVRVMLPHATSKPENEKTMKLSLVMYFVYLLKPNN